MNDNDIIKALAYCSNDYNGCSGCPLFSSCWDEYGKSIAKCRGVLIRLAHEVVIHKITEIERLETELKAMRGAANSLKMHLQTARAEAIKEFAERLKQTRSDLYGIEMVAVGNIDAILEQMTEE